MQRDGQCLYTGLTSMGVWGVAASGFLQGCSSYVLEGFRTPAIRPCHLGLSPTAGLPCRQGKVGNAVIAGGRQASLIGSLVSNYGPWK